MGELIEQVASYNNEENALGYSVYFYARNMYQKPGLRFMAVDGVMPDNDTIKKGDYPYVNEFYAALRADEPEDSPAFQLFSWLTEEDGQALIESLGYVGVEEADHIYVDVEAAPEAEPGTVTLESGSRVLIDGDYLNGQEDIMVLDENMAVEQTITSKRMDRNVINLWGNQAAAMRDTDTDKWGLYSVEEQRWVVEPVYDVIYREDENRDFTAYKEGKPYRVCWNGGTSRYDERPGYYERVGDRWWLDEEGTYRIFEGEQLPDEDKVPIRELDFSERGFSYGYKSGDYFIVTFEDGSQEVYDTGGELVFGEGITGKKAAIYDLSPYWVQASDMDGGERQLMDAYIYNFSQGKIVTAPGDRVEDTDSFRYFCVDRNGEKVVLDEKGEVVHSSEGKTFDRILGNGFCGRWQDGKLTAENPVTGKNYVIQCQESAQADMLTDRMLLLFYSQEGGGNREQLYLDGRLLAEGEYVSYYSYGDIWQVGEAEREVLVGSDGKILYEAKENERIVGVYPQYLMLQRGNYLCFTDYEGRCGFQALFGYMGDD